MGLVATAAEVEDSFNVVAAAVEILLEAVEDLGEHLLGVDEVSVPHRAYAVDQIRRRSDGHRFCGR